MILLWYIFSLTITKCVFLDTDIGFLNFLIYLYILWRRASEGTPIILLYWYPLYILRTHLMFHLIIINVHTVKGFLYPLGDLLINRLIVSNNFPGYLKEYAYSSAVRVECYPYQEVRSRKSEVRSRKSEVGSVATLCAGPCSVPCYPLATVYRTVYLPQD